MSWRVGPAHVSAIRLDIIWGQGGHRSAWVAASELGRRWAEAHPRLVAAAPEQIEQYHAPVDPLLAHAWNDGLVVGHDPDCLIWFPGTPRPCAHWRRSEADRA